MKCELKLKDKDFQLFLQLLNLYGKNKIYLIFNSNNDTFQILYDEESAICLKLDKFFYQHNIKSSEPFAIDFNHEQLLTVTRQLSNVSCYMNLQQSADKKSKNIYMQCQFFNSTESIGDIDNCVSELNIEVNLMRGSKYEKIQQTLDEYRGIFDNMQKEQSDRSQAARIILQQNDNLADYIPVWTSNTINIQYTVDAYKDEEEDDQNEIRQSQNQGKYVLQDVQFRQECITTSIKTKELAMGRNEMHMEITLNKTKFINAAKRVVLFNKLVGNSFRSVIYFNEKECIVSSCSVKNTDNNQTSASNEYFICLLMNIEN